MKNLIKHRMIFILILFFFSTCLTYKKKEVPIEQIIQFCNFIEIDKPFEMRILEYIHTGCFCGVRICASNCVGVNTDNDTIRVFSICNTDSTFFVNQLVTVTPQPKPSGQITIAQIWISEGNNIYLSGFQRKYLNTIFGNLSIK
ncbi:MAG: hypothetical protein PHT69_05330 [Bacteroidales bacterium]|nr:hypothetical protein [Bacteroidales bacterium]